jgi:ATP phosphoribosyltransferase
MNELREVARNATNILIPKGDDNKASVDAFQQWADIEVPSFQGRELMAKSGGRVFWLFKGKDIPGLIASGNGDIGMTGTDSVIEYGYGSSERATRLSSHRIGAEMCRFSLLSLEADRFDISKLLESKKTEPTLNVVTSKPKLLQYTKGNLPIRINSAEINGSVEAALQLIGVPMAADIVQSGETARQNGLEVVTDLLRIYPEIVGRISYEN